MVQVHQRLEGLHPKHLPPRLCLHGGRQERGGNWLLGRRLPLGARLDGRHLRRRFHILEGEPGAHNVSRNAMKNICDLDMIVSSKD